MDVVLRLLEHRRWDKYCRRTNIATPDQITDGPFRRARLMSNKLRKNEHELLEAIKAIAPEWRGDLILNKNVTCARHRDKYNDGHSWILMLGEFEGGALVFDDGRRIEGPGWHKFDGQEYHHNEPHIGDKYSIVLYKPTKESCGAQIARRRKAKECSVASATEP
jgi:hypothetical protein